MNTIHTKHSVGLNREKHGMTKHGEPCKFLFRPAWRGRVPRDPTVLLCCAVAVSFMQSYVGTRNIVRFSLVRFYPPPRSPPFPLFSFLPSQGGVARQPELPLRGLHANGRHQLSGVQAVRWGDEGQLRVPSLSGNQSPVVNSRSSITNRQFRINTHQS